MSSMSVMGPKQGDLEPKLVIDIADHGSPPADFNTVVSWRMIARLRGMTSGTVFIDTDPDVAVDGADPSKVVLSHVWVAGETSTPGVIEVECEATWPTGRPQTFPNSGYEAVTIDDTLA